MVELCPFIPASAGLAAVWARAGKEPPLCEVLADPLVHLVMRRDGVSPAGLRAVIAAAQTRLGNRPCERCAA